MEGYEPLYTLTSLFGSALVGVPPTALCLPETVLPRTIYIATVKGDQQVRSFPDSFEGSAHGRYGAQVPQKLGLAETSPTDDTVTDGAHTIVIHALIRPRFWCSSPPSDFL